jgi:outer membrane protein OmpA-like peptidoglycan-associated protein
MSRLLQSGAIQTKLTVGPADDEYEREADRVADEVMRMAPPSGTRAGAASQLQRVCAECEKEEERTPAEVTDADVRRAPESVQCLRAERGEYLQRTPIEIQRMCPACEDEELEQEAQHPVGRRARAPQRDVAREHEPQIAAFTRGGMPLPRETREYFEPRFGHDFGAVRVHTNPAAAESARTMGARAFTLRQNIVFGQGEFAPQTTLGRHLLAHELVHTLQQGRSGRMAAVVQRTCDPSPIAAVVAGRAACTDTFDGTFVPGSLFRFKQDCDEFATGQAAMLRAFATAFLPLPTKFEIHGFASVDGPVAFNQDLGCARALAAKAVLTDPLPSGAGIPAGRLTGIINHGPVPGPAADRRSVVILTTTPVPPPPPPATATCATPTNPDEHGAAFNPTTAGEDRTCITNPFDCRDAFDCRDTAFSQSDASRLPGRHLGPRDALRHCIWSCCMAQEMGSASEAEKFGTAHENSKPSPIPFDDNIDLHNNSIGRGIGAGGGDCEAGCLAALSAGRLRTIRGPEADSSAAGSGLPPASPPVPTTCIGPSDQTWP